ncbi:unnamed protein product, partial [Ectocarpus sp. 12 AP-2014]
MAGASSLQDDILALVKKHSDTCLPEDLLARVSEDARLLAAKMKIRSLHEEDPFGLFSDGRDEEGAENGGGGEGARKIPSNDELPDNVLRMLEGMKINRLDKSSIKDENVPDSSNLVPHSQVAALNGFTTIDAEVEFSRTGTDSTATAAASASTDGPAVTSAAATRGKPTLSEGTVAAAARAAAAAGGTATTGGEEDEGTSSDEDDDDDHDDDAESPVFLTFRFRREPLRRGPAESWDVGSKRVALGGDVHDNDHQKAGEVIDLALDDDDDGKERPSAVISTTPKGDNEGGSLFEKKGSATAVPAKLAAGEDVACDDDGGGGGDRHGKEGRKRAGSRGRESEEGRGGNDKGRKRPKGGEEEEEEEEEEEGADDEEGGKLGVNGDANQCEEDDE